MNNDKDVYKKFIEWLVKIHKCVYSSWVKKEIYLEINDNEKINELLKELNTDGKYNVSSIINIYLLIRQKIYITVV